MSRTLEQSNLQVRLHNNYDSIENNLCESFNNAIIRAIFYPMITSMEIIRKKGTARI
jgi:hypothetical protein